MKKSSCYLIIGILFCVHQLQAQTSENPWRLRLAVNVIDIYPTAPDANAPFADTQGGFMEGFFQVGDHWNFGFPAIELSRYLAGGFSIGVMGSANTLKKVAGTSGLAFPYNALEGFLKFSPSRRTIRPYVLLGYGLSSFDTSSNKTADAFLLSKNASKTYFGGVGFDLKMGSKLFFSIASTYKNPTENYGIKHFQHQIGLSYDFGVQDRDGDGVSDKKDQCPDQAGLKEFGGCPDQDGDGIIDGKDSCPELPGSAALQGCPDTDNDGVADQDDLCPDVAGPIVFDGCPDTDDDTVHDALDPCPEEKGPVENKGCPWPDSDGDGVPDMSDLCPDEKGLIEANGCPVLADAIIQTINEFGSMINFMAESDQILGSKTYNTLEKITALLVANPSGTILIEGYASEDGSTAYNQKLSLQRAAAVKRYLVAKGIDPKRLEIVGLGETGPIEDNKTPGGRAKNRRVQFKSKH